MKELSDVESKMEDLEENEIDESNIDQLITKPYSKFTEISPGERMNIVGLVSLPKEFDHLTSYRPDPTHDVILTYHIWVYYTGGILAGTPETGTPGDPEYDPGTPDVIIADGWEIHTVTQKVLNNTDQHRKILSWLLQKQRSVEDQQALYGFGTADPKYNPYAVVE